MRMPFRAFALMVFAVSVEFRAPAFTSFEMPFQTTEPPPAPFFVLTAAPPAAVTRNEAACASLLMVPAVIVLESIFEWKVFVMSLMTTAAPAALSAAEMAIAPVTIRAPFFTWSFNGVLVVSVSFEASTS
ncbi:MAG: hypothetical protein BWY66_00276 [bacterium ADurb.Bin374]|nr:MAG: hypothetical protein BWY66_00276 [bacterium ADurb.Bin374]